MADAERWLGERKVALNRGDLGFGHDAIMAWHEAAPARPKFLLKLKLTTLVRSALHRLKESDWQGPATLVACQSDRRSAAPTQRLDKHSSGDLCEDAARRGAGRGPRGLLGPAQT